MFGFVDKSRLLNAEIEIEKLRLENDALKKRLDEALDAVQIIANNQAYLAREIVSINETLSSEIQKHESDPIDEYLKKVRKKTSKRYLN